MNLDLCFDRCVARDLRVMRSLSSSPGTGPWRMRERECEGEREWRYEWSEREPEPREEMELASSLSLSRWGFFSRASVEWMENKEVRATLRNCSSASACGGKDTTHTNALPTRSDGSQRHNKHEFTSRSTS